MFGPTSRKRRKVEDDVPSCSKEIDESERKLQEALEDIEACQLDIDRLNEDSINEILQVERKFNQFRRPLFDKRSELANKFPDFWMTIMTNHPQLAHLFDEDENNCLLYLKGINVEECEDIKSGYRLTFTFDEANPFFTNTVLVKEYNFPIDGIPTSTSTKIKWRPNMNLLKKQEKELEYKRKLGLSLETFFSWFNNHEIPYNDVIADAIKDDLWASPLHYYLKPESESEIDEDEDEDEGIDEGDSEEESSFFMEKEDDEQEKEQDGESVLDAIEEEEEESVLDAIEEEDEESVLYGIEGDDEESVLYGIEEEEEELSVLGAIDEEEDEESALDAIDEEEEEEGCP